MMEPTSAQERFKRVFEKSHAEAIRFSIRRIEARSIIVSIRERGQSTNPDWIVGFASLANTSSEVSRRDGWPGIGESLPIVYMLKEG
jgi:hypothetical protein